MTPKKILTGKKMHKTFGFKLITAILKAVFSLTLVSVILIWGSERNINWEELSTDDNFVPYTTIIAIAYTTFFYYDEHKRNN